MNHSFRFTTKTIPQSSRGQVTINQSGQSCDFFAVNIGSVFTISELLRVFAISSLLVVQARDPAAIGVPSFNYLFSS
jgi:hypothetical protein